MTERETGQIMAQVEALTNAVENLTKEMRSLRETHAYGKGVLAALLFVAGSLGAALALAVKVWWR